MSGKPAPHMRHGQTEPRADGECFEPRVAPKVFRKSRKKPYRLGLRSRSNLAQRMGWVEWRYYKRYRTEKDLMQAFQAHARDDYWRAIDVRAVGPDGEVLAEHIEETQ